MAKASTVRGVGGLMSNHGNDYLQASSDMSVM